MALEGLAAGLIVAAVAAADGRDTPSGRNSAIWLAVLGFLGMLSADTQYVLNSVLAWRNDA